MSGDIDSKNSNVQHSPSPVENIEESRSERLTFLILPNEIRTQIYSCLFRNFSLRPTYPCDKQLNFDASGLSILLVNHQCHREAESSLWSNARLTLLDDNNGEKLLAKVQQKNLNKCTQLGIPFSMATQWNPRRVQTLFPRLKLLAIGNIIMFGLEDIYEKCCDKTGKSDREKLQRLVRFAFLEDMHTIELKPIREHCISTLNYQIRLSINGLIDAYPTPLLSLQAAFQWDNGVLDAGEWDWKEMMICARGFENMSDLMSFLETPTDPVNDGD